MPVFIDPTTVTPPTPTVSSDGVLTLTPRSEWAAVSVKVDFTQALASSVAATVWTVTVTRTDGGIVRGMDGIVAPRGVCVGWDQEFTTGPAATWVARSYNRAGALVATSQTATVLMTRPAKTWLKDITDPRLSTAFTVTDEVAWKRARPTGFASPVGGRLPAAGVDARKGRVGGQPFLTLTLAETLRMRALLHGGPVYLVQPGSVAFGNGFPDTFGVIEDVDETPIQNALSPGRSWALPLTQVARPYTAGSSIPIPGLTFAEAPSAGWSSLSGRLVDYTGV